MSRILKVLPFFSLPQSCSCLYHLILIPAHSKVIFDVTIELSLVLNAYIDKELFLCISSPVKK